jgi:hypothetical protein
MLYFLLDQLKTDTDSLDFQKKINQSSEFQITQVNYECYSTKQDDEKKIFDILGTFNSKYPNGINMCHDKIKKYSDKSKLKYSIIFDIVSIHEYAHLIHYATNQTKFIEGDSGFIDRKHYVEAWSQWCTFKVCKKLDEKIGNADYTAAFEFLIENQSSEYYEYKKYLDWHDDQVKHLFLNPESWIGLLRNEFLIQGIDSWTPELKQTLIDKIECLMKSRPEYIAVALKEIWKKPNFENIKKEINIPNSYIEGGFMEDQNLLSDLGGIGL